MAPVTPRSKSPRGPSRSGEADAARESPEEQLTFELVNPFDTHNLQLPNEAKWASK